jgi:hypothetical protein
MLTPDFFCYSVVMYVCMYYVCTFVRTFACITYVGSHLCYASSIRSRRRSYKA